MRVTVVGAGSIGSNLVVLLARLGVQEITVIDDDVVEAHNLGHQDYKLTDIGRLKVEALRDRVKEIADIDINIQATRVDGTDMKTDILVLAVDNMQSRKQILENADYQFCVDGRMGGESLYVYSFSSLQEEEYWETWVADEEIPSLPCGGKSINYVSYFISALMEISIKKFINQEPVAFEQIFDAKELHYYHSNV
jgi:hypothetical protein